MPRLFISIPVPQNICWALQAIAEEYLPKLPHESKVSPVEQFHFTLLFLGEIEEKYIPQIEEVITRVVAAHSPPQIKIDRLVYGPMFSNPRMLWAMADKDSSVAMGKMAAAFVAELKRGEISFFHEANRDFTAHITLARWDMPAAANLPGLDERLDFSFMPQNAELVESELSRNGAIHKTLSTFEFKKSV